jgi:dynein light chain 1, axonemal
MESLRILSLGRNLLKKIENVEAVTDSLEELWLSYNQIERLTGVEKLGRLRVLFLSNNRIKDWSEVERLASIGAKYSMGSSCRCGSWQGKTAFCPSAQHRQA